MRYETISLLGTDSDRPTYTRCPRCINASQYYTNLGTDSGAPQITDLVSLRDPSSLGQWLLTEFQTIASIIITGFSTVILFRCVFSGFQGALPLTFNISATQEVKYPHH